MTLVETLFKQPWDRSRLRNTLAGITVFLVIVFITFYWIGRGPLSLLGYSFAAEGGQYRFLTNIYGDSEDSLAKRPMAVAADKTQIYVVDSGKQRVLIFDYTGRYKGQFGSPGEDKGQFKFPYGIALDSSGYLYVGDIGTGKISIFDSNGKFISYFGTSKDISKPAGIYVFGDQVIVADIDLHRISIFDKEGNLVRSIGKKGDQVGEFNSPNALFVKDGILYVSDSGNNRVQVFNIMGTFLREIMLDPDGNQYLVNPRGIVADAVGNIYVVSNITHKVVVFEKDGGVLYNIGSMGNNDGELYLPNGLGFDEDGRLLVTDTVNQRVVVFAK